MSPPTAGAKNLEEGTQLKLTVLRSLKKRIQFPNLTGGRLVYGEKNLPLLCHQDRAGCHRNNAFDDATAKHTQSH